MDGESLCVLYGFQDDVICDENSVWGDQPIRDATAHLIAAAPDLYQALKTLLFNCRHGNGLEAQYQALDKAESALAKAEGRS